jgi:hypothetical protein
MGSRNWAILGYMSESTMRNKDISRFSAQYSIVPSFQHSLRIRLHPSGVNSKPGPPGPDSLQMC